MLIRKASTLDLDQIAQLHFESFHKANDNYINANLDSRSKYHYELTDFKLRWLKRLSKDESITYVAMIDKEIKGFITLILTNGHEEVLFLYVATDSWRLGIGKSLINFAKSIYENNGSHDVTIWAMKASDQARRFYESQGAICTNEIKNNEKVFDAEEIKFILHI